MGRVRFMVTVALDLECRVKKTFKGTMTTASFRINRMKLSFSSKKDGTLLRIQSKCEGWEDGKGKMETAVVFTPVSSAVGQKS